MYVLNVKNIIRIKPINNSCKSQIAYVENNLCKRYDNKMFNNTNNTCEHINQYSTDINNYNINKT